MEQLCQSSVIFFITIIIIKARKGNIAAGRKDVFFFFAALQIHLSKNSVKHNDTVAS